MANQHTRRENAVLLHHPDAVDLGREKIMGRQAAGAGFLEGFVRHAGVDKFLCHVLEPGHGDDFAARVEAFAGNAKPSVSVALNGMSELAETDRTLVIPDPALGVHAWRRRGLGARQYSLCGINHTIASDGAMDGLGALLTSPVQPWDAVICTSRSVKAVISRILDNQADFLSRRGGGAFTVQAKLPVIPLGVNCDRFATGEDRERIRASLRRGLGIGDNDVVFLFFGRLSFHAKAHPLPMYLALEEAARRTGKRVHLLQTGRFPNDGIEKEFRDGARQYAPSINSIFLDGRDEAVCRDVWYAADVFTSLSDNVQESFGLTPIEAMAAGLPSVVSDWNGYRDTVRDGEDGFAIPTWLPLPGSGGDLALQNDALVSDGERDRNYNHYCGVVSQCTAIDVASAVDAYAVLMENEGQRKGMGASGRQFARQNFDWRVIVGAYQDLWRELAHIRSRTQEIAGLTDGRPVHPLRDDPFTLFTGYASATIDGATMVRPLIRDGENFIARFQQLRTTPMNDFAAAAMLPQAALDQLLGLLADGAARDVFALAKDLPEDTQYRLPRTLAWLAKLGAISLQSTGAGVQSSTQAISGNSETSRLVALGLAAGGRGAWTAARDYFVQALRVDPGDSAANTELGKLQARQGDLDAAISSFDRSLSREPGGLSAQRNMGKVLLLAGRGREGLEALEKAGSLAPEDAETQYLLGTAYRRMGEANKALAGLERCIELDANRTDAYTHLGLVRKSLDRRDDAAASFDRALEIDPHNVYARAELLNLNTEAAGRERLAGSSRGRRVALHFNRRGQFAVLEALLNSLNVDHWPMITGDGRALQEFDPQVTIIAGEHASSIRSLTAASIVNLRSGLASENFFTRVKDPGDAVCVTSDHVAADVRKQSNLSETQIWVTGTPALDPLFRGDVITLPEGLSANAPTVLYAPADRTFLSSAGLLMRRPIELLRGGRNDINVILKPHPNSCEQTGGWLDEWSDLMASEPNVHVCTDPTIPAISYMPHADVMVSDATSAMLEFLALDRPLIRVLNPEKFRDETHYDPSGYEWAWPDMGEEVQDVELLSETVARVVDGDDTYIQQRARYRQHIFADLKDGRAADRIAAHISAMDS